VLQKWFCVFQQQKTTIKRSWFAQKVEIATGFDEFATQSPSQHLNQ
jgi:hypothetical protein